MSISELVTTQHLSRKAIIYIRQSTPHQVLTNQESLNLQYALKQRALSLGWRDQDIEVIDADLGLTAAAAEPERSGRFPPKKPAPAKVYASQSSQRLSRPLAQTFCANFRRSRRSRRPGKSCRDTRRRASHFSNAYYLESHRHTLTLVQHNSLPQFMI